MKKFEVIHEPSQRKEIKNEREIAEMLLPEGFMMILNRLSINESIYHQLTMLNFKRIE